MITEPSPDLPAARDSLVLALQRVTHLSLHALVSHLRGLDLAPSEINALANLAGGSGRTVGDLGTAIGARPTTVTSLVDRLERRGMLIRTRHPTDRRAVVVGLTPQGATAARAVAGAVADLEARAVARVTDADVCGFRAVLQALAGASA